MNMRIFISINLPENIRGEIKKIQDKLPEFNGKKTESENLHLTLKFLGEIDEDKINEVREKLKEVEHQRFETSVKYLGFFDNVKRGKRYGIVWLHLKGCDELQKEIDEKLKGLFEIEKRFMSHLTIARVKSIKNKKEFLRKLKEIKIPEIKFEIGKFYLMKSKLDSQGPVYEDVEFYSLEN